MNTFHSSGTPIGIDDRMPKWKHSMTNAAIAVGQPPLEKNNTNGTSPSTAVLKCASHRDSRPGRRSSGKCSKNFRLMKRGRNTGLLLIIVEITNGKCLLSLDVAAPSQITRQTSLAATIMSTPENSATSSITSNAAYSNASTGVRVLPVVNGTRFGHGGNRMVLGRNQYRIEPIGGKNRLFSGPKPQPSPMTSNSIV